jgi:hypothetical protein
VAIVQISQITNRKGLQADLPQLAGAELGWSIDERRLFIGNGTLQEGAPVIGNTEILTEFSDILNVVNSYTYKGEAAGYTVQTGPTTGTPVVQTLQSWLDQFATVKDFGAVGDGVTDDTDAINRALYQLYCVQTNPQIRRSLFFPAGVYRVSESIVIPPFATLYGEGADASIIQLQSGDDSALTAYVARTGDSLQQTGAAIGTNDAAYTPQYVTITNMGFESLDPDAFGVMFLEDLVNSSINNCTFMGPYDTTFITANTNTYPLSGVIIESTNGTASNITIDRCVYSGCTWGVYNALTNIDSVRITNGNFDTLWAGVSIGTGATSGTRILHNRFDNIYDYGVYVNSSDSGTGYNLFLDVANGFDGAGNPINYVELLYGSCVSFGDMFVRDDTDAETWSRIAINGATIATTNGQQLQMGTYIRQSGASDTLINDTGSPTEIFSVNGTTTLAFSVNYTIIRGTAYRTGTLTVATSGADSTGDLAYSDDYVENNQTGIDLTVSESTNTVSVNYTSTDIGNNATIKYSVTNLA